MSDEKMAGAPSAGTSPETPSGAEIARLTRCCREKDLRIAELTNELNHAAATVMRLRVKYEGVRGKIDAVMEEAGL